MTKETFFTTIAVVGILCLIVSAGPLAFAGVFLMLWANNYFQGRDK